MIHNQTINQHSQNIATDMQLLKQLAQPINESEAHNSVRLNNIGNLSQMLRLKNSRFCYSEQARQNGQEWIRRKGGDLNPLITRIKHLKKEGFQKMQDMEAEADCYFHIGKFSYEKREDYVNRNLQFGVLTTVKTIMSEQPKGNLASRIMSQRSQRREVKQKDPSFGLPNLCLQIRNPQKKLAYILQTRQILQSMGGIHKTHIWPSKYLSCTNKQFWQILSTQFSTFCPSPSSTSTSTSTSTPSMSSLSQASLQMVESEFNTQLPPNYDNILYYLTNHYLNKVRGQYDTQGELGPVWGISYLLYRAGRKDWFYGFVPDQGLKASFQMVDAAILQGTPKRVEDVEETNDVFYNQLIYALKGTAKCASQALCNPNTLDIVWVFLRNVGIFATPEDKEFQKSFLQLRRQLFVSYKSPSISFQQLQNLLYLFCYGQLCQLGPSQQLDPDDYLHFLISIYHSPAQLSLTQSQQNLLTNLLTSHLIQYIQELILEKKEEFYYYLLLLPRTKIAEVVSDVVVGEGMLNGWNWGVLKTGLQEGVFQEIVAAVLDKYVAYHQDYVLVAKKYCELLNNHKAALDLLIQSLIKYFLSPSLSSTPLPASLTLCSQLVQQCPSLSSTYTPILNFFTQFQTLVSLLQQRNEHRLYNFLQSSTFILISSQLSNQVRTCLGKLVEQGGFDVYVEYLRMVAMAEEIALIRLGRERELVQIKALTQLAVRDLIKADMFVGVANSDRVRSLLGYLKAHTI